jgi:hypothetical protein
MSKAVGGAVEFEDVKGLMSDAEVAAGDAEAARWAARVRPHTGAEMRAHGLGLEPVRAARRLERHATPAADSWTAPAPEAPEALSAQRLTGRRLTT